MSEFHGIVYPTKPPPLLKIQGLLIGEADAAALQRIVACKFRFWLNSYDLESSTMGNQLGQQIYVARTVAHRTSRRMARCLQEQACRKLFYLVVACL
jgi:hypothetical protein